LWRQPKTKCLSGDLVTEKAQEQLQALDFNAYFAVAVFLDVHAHREHITIERILRRGDTVLIYTRMGDRAAHELLITPHHLVKVRKEYVATLDSPILTATRAAAVVWGWGLASRPGYFAR
jgi:hypothetical protein